MLKPLVPVYAAALNVKERLLERGWLRQRRLTHPVLSVGSLSAGGAGKTPVVIMLAELLAERGFDVRILTRGYGRQGRGIERVVLDTAGRTDAEADADAAKHADAARFGDEPVMLARCLPRAHVWVAANRYAAGRMSERDETGTGTAPAREVVYLLDDGFQHRKLARDVDVVLLTRQELSDSLLPMGNLREPLKAIGRADVIVLREDEGFAGGISGKAATWFVRRELRFAPGAAPPKRPVAFCGLARPEGFFAMLAKAGIEVVAVRAFRDHHAYSMGDVEALAELAHEHGADGFITTEKDAVKLTPAMRTQLGVVAVAELRVRLLEDQAAIDRLLELLAARTPF